MNSCHSNFRNCDNSLKSTGKQFWPGKWELSRLVSSTILSRCTKILGGHRIFYPHFGLYLNFTLHKNGWCDPTKANHTSCRWLHIYNKRSVAMATGITGSVRLPINVSEKRLDEVSNFTSLMIGLSSCRCWCRSLALVSFASYCIVSSGTLELSRRSIWKAACRTLSPWSRTGLCNGTGHVV